MFGGLLALQFCFLNLKGSFWGALVKTEDFQEIFYGSEGFKNKPVLYVLQGQWGEILCSWIRIRLHESSAIEACRGSLENTYRKIIFLKSYVFLWLNIESLILFPMEIRVNVNASFFSMFRMWQALEGSFSMSAKSLQGIPQKPKERRNHWYKNEFAFSAYFSAS